MIGVGLICTGLILVSILLLRRWGSCLRRVTMNWRNPVSSYRRQFRHILPNLRGIRGLPCLAFLIGYLIAFAIRFNNSYTYNVHKNVTYNIFPIPEQGFCGINDGDGDDFTRGLGLIQNKVVFVMTTKFKLDQVTTLTKIAQSLFPVRNDVLWIVVSTTVDKDLIRQPPKISNTKGKNYSEPKLRMKIRSNLETNRTRRVQHLTNLHKLLVRFGIPFVLIEAKNPDGLKYWTCKVNFVTVSGLATGVDWVLKNIHGGVLMMGDEQFSYHHRIFKEVHETNTASAWAVGLGRFHGFSSPIYYTSVNVGMGYFNGNSRNVQERHEPTIPLEIGGSAIRIEYLQQSDKLRNILLDATICQKTLTFESLSIPNHEVQVLGKNGSEILVWRTQNFAQYFPKTLQYQRSFANSSIIKLWQNIFTVMFDQIPVASKYLHKNSTILV